MRPLTGPPTSSRGLIIHRHRRTEILRRFVHFEHPKHVDETRMYVTEGCGLHGVWGEAPAANSFFLFFCTMKRILGQKMRIIGNSWLDEPMGQNIGDEGSSLSGGRAPQSRRLCWYGNSHYIRRPYPVASFPWGGSAPRYFQHEKMCVKAFRTSE